MRKRTILIIFWFVVSIMLIGIFISCKGIGEESDISSENSVENESTETTPSEETTQVPDIAVPTYFEFAPELEPLTEDQMYEIKEAWGVIGIMMFL